jgi:hypothetical protein
VRFLLSLSCRFMSCACGSLLGYDCQLFVSWHVRMARDVWPVTKVYEYINNFYAGTYLVHATLLVPEAPLAHAESGSVVGCAAFCGRKGLRDEFCFFSGAALRGPRQLRGI